LKFERGQGDDLLVAHVLNHLSSTNQQLGLREEAILQAKEALKICERLGDTVAQGCCAYSLAFSLYKHGQFDAAEEVASRSIELFPEKGEEFLLCRSHRLLGDIYRLKGEREKAIHHFQVALGYAFPSDWHFPLFWIHHSLSSLSLEKDRFYDAQVYLERAKAYAINEVYCQGRASLLQAGIWHRRHKLEEAKVEACRALEIFQRLGASGQLNSSRDALQRIEESMRATSSVPDSSGAGEYFELWK
jgi:tetratricopeptide (TPR) repeat protein